MNEHHHGKGLPNFDVWNSDVEVEGLKAGHRRAWWRLDALLDEYILLGAATVHGDASWSVVVSWLSPNVGGNPGSKMDNSD